MRGGTFRSILGPVRDWLYPSNIHWNLVPKGQSALTDLKGLKMTAMGQ